MYKITICTNFGIWYLTSEIEGLPTDEFIRCKNQGGEWFYINRNQILSYKIRKEG